MFINCEEKTSCADHFKVRCICMNLLCKTHMRIIIIVFLLVNDLKYLYITKPKFGSIPL
jgi:hypothetical protein